MTATERSPERYITLDEDGLFAFDGQRVDDPEFGAQLIQNLKIQNGRQIQTSLNGQSAWVEAFDAPLIARHVSAVSSQLGQLELSYGVKQQFPFATLTCDEWDRFHGQTTDGMPFVFSRQAQVEFFDLLDAFDDDSVTVQGQRHAIEPWLKPSTEAGQEKFWSNFYQTGSMPWDQNREHPALPEILPQLKLSKAKVLVLGCGRGHDAAFLARAGHLVTGVDLSPDAIRAAKELYGGLENLSLIQGDAFRLPEAWTGRFDLVFEHTCYCAIPPERRSELVQGWRRVLAPQGRLLGVFFAIEMQNGPPFGGSEWEVRERLRRNFEFLYWTRWRRSSEGRQGAELVVFAQKKFA